MTIRSDVVGSVLRPAYLVEARASRDAGHLSPDDFKRIEDRAIDEAAKLVALERLGLTPQCGFASTMEGNLISPERQREKLARVAETARIVWGGSSTGGPR